MGGLIAISIVISIAIIGAVVGWLIYQRKIRDAKNYERSLKMVSLRIHLPPPSDDVKSEGRDHRDIADETISKAASMYNIIASTATKGFGSKLYGQRHLTFEILAKDGLVHYFVVVPFVLIEQIKQAVLSAYPMARIEEADDSNIFSQSGKLTGVLGGELSLKREHAYPIATYQETKKDAMLGILNALSTASKDEGVGIQIMIRPAQEGWRELGKKYAKNLKDGKKVNASSNAVVKMTGVASALWTPPGSKKDGEQPKTLSQNDQKLMEALEEKIRHRSFDK